MQPLCFSESDRICIPTKDLLFSVSKQSGFGSFGSHHGWITCCCPERNPCSRCMDLSEASHQSECLHSPTLSSPSYLNKTDNRRSKLTPSHLRKVSLFLLGKSLLLFDSVALLTMHFLWSVFYFEWRRQAHFQKIFFFVFLLSLSFWLF